MNTLLIATHCSLENKLLGNYLSFQLLMSLLYKNGNFSHGCLQAWPFPARGPRGTGTEVTLVGHLCHPGTGCGHQLQMMVFSCSRQREKLRELLSWENLKLRQSQRAAPECTPSIALPLHCRALCPPCHHKVLISAFVPILFSALETTKSQ